VCVSGISAHPDIAGDFFGTWAPFLLLAACWAVLLAAERAKTPLLESA